MEEEMTVDYKGEVRRLLLFAVVAILIVLIIFALNFWMEIFGIRAIPNHCQYGDINGDGVVSNADYYYPIYTWYQKERGDVDGDGDVDMNDRSLILQYVDGDIDKFPVGDINSPSYKEDKIPSLSIGTSPYKDIYTGETVYIYCVGNDSNGETLTIKLSIKYGNTIIYETNAEKVEPSITKTFEYTFNNAGKYTLIATVNYAYRTGIGLPYNITKTITVIEGNKPPVADFSWTPANPKVGEEITFDASPSYDPDGYITNYEWKVGINTLIGKIIKYTFIYPGNYFISLKVTDNGGKYSYHNTTIYVSEEDKNKPVANFDFTVSGRTVYFVDKSIDPDGIIVSYLWNFGDGKTSNEVNPIHTYSSYGTYSVKLTVTDNDGLEDNITKYITIYKEGNPPVANFSYFVDGLTVDFYDNSFDLDGFIVNYTWNFGDGSIAYGKTVSHEYSTSGEYTVTLTVTDDDGLTSSKTVTISVSKGNIYLLLLAGLIPAVAGAIYLKKRRRK